MRTRLYLIVLTACCVLVSSAIASAFDATATLADGTSVPGFGGRAGSDTPPVSDDALKALDTGGDSVTPVGDTDHHDASGWGKGDAELDAGDAGGKEATRPQPHRKARPAGVDVDRNPTTTMHVTGSNARPIAGVHLGAGDRSEAQPPADLGSDDEQQDSGFDRATEHGGDANDPAERAAMAPIRLRKPLQPDKEAVDHEAANEWHFFELEERLSLDLEREAEANDSPALRGVRREMLGRYTRQAERRRVGEVLRDYRKQRSDQRATADAAASPVALYEAFQRASKKSYRLFDQGARIQGAPDVELFDYWRFVFRGAFRAEDKRAANSALDALDRNFGSDPKYQEFLEDKHRRVEEF